MAQARFIKSVIKTAQAEDTPKLPWSRGARRAEMIARRSAATAHRKSA